MQPSQFGVGSEEDLMVNFSKLIVGEKIGEGESGMVRSVLYNDRSHAAKFLSVASQSDYIKREILAEERFRAAENPTGSQNVSRILLYAYTEGYFVLVMHRMEMTLCEYGSSSAWPGRLPDELIAQILDGIAFMHRAGIAHADLSWKNIMVDGPHLRIVDMGDSKEVLDGWEDDMERLRVRMRHILYGAPEAEKYTHLLTGPVLTASEMLEAVRDISRNQILALSSMKESKVRTRISEFLLR